MGVLDSVLAYKAQKEAQANADLQAIPQGIAAFTAAKQAASDNLLKTLTLKGSLAEHGLRINPAGNDIMKDPSLEPTKKVFQWGVGANGTPTLIEAGTIGNKDVVSKPSSEKMIDTGSLDASGNPILKPASQANFDQRREITDNNSFQRLIKQNQDTLASSRSTLGVAAGGNLRADRALAILKEDKVTPQALSAVIGDYSGIIQGGAPTDQVMNHSEYSNLATQWANISQKLSTGNTTNAVSPELKDYLTKQFLDLKKVNTDLINRHYSLTEKANGSLIKRHQEDWNNFKNEALKSTTPDSSSSDNEMISIRDNQTGKVEKMTKAKAKEIGAI